MERDKNRCPPTPTWKQINLSNTDQLLHKSRITFPPISTTVYHTKMSLSDSNINKLSTLLKKPNTKFIFLVGAGISTSAGIPDFRSPNTGLYHNLQKLKLPYAEAVFDIDYFAKNPKPFFVLSKELYPGQFIPTAFHLFMKLLEDKGKLLRIYTQNIDTLERISGVGDEYIVEAHGSFNENHCIDCHEEFATAKFKQIVFSDEEPRCKKCQGLVKPDITFFGESLPTKFFSTWDKDADKLSRAKEEFVVITAGTSLTVYPFASLPSEVPRKIQRFIINMEVVGDYKERPRKTDVIVKDDIEEYILKVIDETGWSQQYKELRSKVVQKLGLTDKKPAETAEEKAAEITQDIRDELKKEEEEENKSETELITTTEVVDVDIDILVSTVKDLNIKTDDGEAEAK